MSNKRVKDSYADNKNSNFRLNKKENQSKIRNAKKNKEFLQESDNLVGELPSGAFDNINTYSEKKIVIEDKNEILPDIDKEEILEVEEYEEEQFDENYFEPIEYKG